MRVPLATYRLQFNRDFRFKDAQQLLPYLQQLGISHLYASPVLQAARGSPHGYDVTNPLELNAELGPPSAFDRLVRDLHQRGMALMLDVVPNHMSATSDNPWYMDIIEKGPHSRYAQYFDIDWHSRYAPLLGKILVPILGITYGKALESGQLKLKVDERGIALHYYSNRLPLAPRTYAAVLSHRLDGIRRRGGGDKPGLRAYRGLARMAVQVADSHVAEPATLVQDLKEHLWELFRKDPDVREFIEENLRQFNGREGDPRSFDLLDHLLDAQYFWLTYWRMANEQINYRRFFAISQLISVRVEDEQVFRATHELVFRLIREGKVDALRIDHIDGLYDPTKYLIRLQAAIADQRTGYAHSAGVPGGELAALTSNSAAEAISTSAFYVVVEKILSQGGETLPPAWPVAGTTGYDFLNALNGVFVDNKGIEELGDVYARLLGRDIDFRDLIYEKKKLIIQTLFSGEMTSLGDELARLAAQDRYARDLPPRLLEDGLRELTACFPVYRTYIDSFEISEHDRNTIEAAVVESRSRNAAGSVHVFDFLRRLLLLEDAGQMEHEKAIEHLTFVMHWQQYTGPIMAKGVEDTALYIYNRLLSENEVGSDPTLAGGECNVFYRQVRARQQNWPHAMNATTTHDTKRGEDVRARINVLSEIPALWERRAERWMRWNTPLKTKVMNRPAPDANDELQLYQTMLGAWPLDAGLIPAFRARLLAYVIKAAREAAVHTRWLKPNPEYESAYQAFVSRLFEPAQARFMNDFVRFARALAYYGAWNGLSQALLKIVCPGVPDFYQGSELWDLRLVDPDNRAPVDFSLRADMLADLARADSHRPASFFTDLIAHWQDARIKLYVIWKALALRNEKPELFTEGDYLPVGARGRRKGNVCSFARCRNGSWVVAAVPRLLTALVSPGESPTGRRLWAHSVLNLPEDAPVEWRDVFTGRTISAQRRGKKTLALADVFAAFPVALLTGSVRSS